MTATKNFDVEVVENSTAKLTLSFFDETGAAVVPNVGLAWSLVDALGTVINNRTLANGVITPASTVTIALHGADLALGGNYSGYYRWLTVEGTYNSALGTNLELKAACRFTITNLIAV